MKKRIAKLLPPAVTAVNNEFPETDRPIPSEYQGYISSFGASVMQGGLLPTLAIFHSNQQRGESSQDRRKILSLIAHILTSNESTLPSRIKSSIRDANLFDAALDLYATDPNLRDLRTHLLDAAVAAKLAIRTFELSNNNG